MCASTRAIPHFQSIATSDWLTVAGYVDLGHRQTQLYEEGHQAEVGLWDARIELWAPPFRRRFAWGVYARLAGTFSNRPPAFENLWLAGPGVGIQVYPADTAWVQRLGVLGRWLGPLRLFAEHDRQRFRRLGEEWRPKQQVRYGIDYYRALHVNRGHAWWSEIYAEGTWRSANEFRSDYNALSAGSALRIGLREPWRHTVSTFGVLESAWSEHQDYDWENRLLVGCGVRLDPDLREFPGWTEPFTRLTLTAEYVHIALYYYHPPPSTTPRHDMRFTISLAIGEFWR